MVCGRPTPLTLFDAGVGSLLKPYAAWCWTGGPSDRLLPLHGVRWGAEDLLVKPPRAAKGLEPGSSIAHPPSPAATPDQDAARERRRSKATVAGWTPARATACRQTHRRCRCGFGRSGNYCTAELLWLTSSGPDGCRRRPSASQRFSRITSVSTTDAWIDVDSNGVAGLRPWTTGVPSLRRRG